MITLTDDIPPAPRQPAEARHPDGRWPVCRPDMVCDLTIIDRMAEDCLAIFDREGSITEAALVRLAWPRDTIRRLADAARESFVRRHAARTRTRLASAA